MFSIVYNTFKKLWLANWTPDNITCTQEVAFSLSLSVSLLLFHLLFIYNTCGLVSKLYLTMVNSWMTYSLQCVNTFHLLSSSSQLAIDFYWIHMVLIKMQIFIHLWYRKCKITKMQKKKKYKNIILIVIFSGWNKVLLRLCEICFITFIKMRIFIKSHSLVIIERNSKNLLNIFSLLHISSST